MPLSKKKIKIYCIVVASAVAILLTSMYYSVKDMFKNSYSAVIYDANGDILGAAVSKEGQWHLPLTTSIPDKFKKCIINYEDKRFFYHFGIDPIAICRALISNIKAGEVVSGGSTITMQTARMANSAARRTLWRKIKETYLATGLEVFYSKNEILEMYAANAPFGGNIVGIESAARKYFRRSAYDLSWAEAAMLAVLPNAPAMIHLNRNRDRLLLKRNNLLLKLKDNGIITQEEYQLSLIETLPMSIAEFPLHAMHLLGKVRNTSLNYSLQTNTETIVDKYAKKYADNYIYNIAVVVSEVNSGKIIAYVGNAPYLKNNNQGYVDVVTAPRSSGSILKPILYAAMMTSSQLLPEMLVSDTPLNIDGFRPENYDKKYRGVTPASEAIRSSLNVPLVRMVNKYGIGKFKSLLRELGVTTMPYSDSHYGSTIILGGAECNLKEIVGVYASLARILNTYNKDNTYDESSIYPISLNSDTISHILRITDSPVLNAAPIWNMFECMSGVNRPEEEMGWQLFNSSKKIAWKTGTSYGGRDAWSIGATPEYVVGVWVGNADGKSRAALTGVGYAAPVMFDVFSLLPATNWFDIPYNDMSQEIVCSKSGHLAGIYCDVTDTLYIPLSGKRTEVCPYHKQIYIKDKDGINTTPKSLFVLSPAQKAYYSLSEVRISDTINIVTDIKDKIEIIYPTWDSELALPRGNDGSRQKVILSCVHSDPNATIFWHLDNEYIGSTNGAHNMAVEIEKGEHILIVVDESGKKNKVRFKITH